MSAASANGNASSLCWPDSLLASRSTSSNPRTKQRHSVEQEQQLAYHFVLFLIGISLSARSLASSSGTRPKRSRPTLEHRHHRITPHPSIHPHSQTHKQGKHVTNLLKPVYKSHATQANSARSSSRKSSTVESAGSESFALWPWRRSGDWGRCIWQRGGRGYAY